MSINVESTHLLAPMGGKPLAGWIWFKGDGQPDLDKKMTENTFLAFNIYKVLSDPV